MSPGLAPVRALVMAQGQATWNRLAREAGQGGRVAAVAVGLLVAVVLGFPAVTLFRLGWGVGEELRAGGAEALAGWLYLQAGLIAGMGLIGGWRFRPSFGYDLLARYPIARRDLLLAELPASLAEVFPLLGATGLLASHLGLACAWPLMAPLVLALGAIAVLTLLAATALAAVAWRLIVRRPWLSLVAVLVLGALLVRRAEEALAAIAGAARALPGWLPPAPGYSALLDLRGGDVPAGALGLLVATASASTVFAVAAAAHSRAAWRGGTSRVRVRRRDTRPPGLAAIFQAQVLSTTGGRLLLFMPLLLTAPLALVVAAIRRGVEHGEAMPEPLVSLADRLGGVSWSWLLFLFVALDSELWLNAFGWDRGGLRTLLQLPLPPERLLAGRLAGLGRFVALQALLALPPLLLVLPLAPGDAVAALGAAAYAVIGAGGLGQLFAMRYPRRVEREGTSSLPPRFAWVPLAVLLPLGGWLATVRALGGAISPAATAVAPLVLAAVAGVLYWRLLPLLARQLLLHRDRLAAV
jgi:hypothetical protein